MEMGRAPEQFWVTDNGSALNKPRENAHSPGPEAKGCPGGDCRRVAIAQLEFPNMVVKIIEATETTIGDKPEG